ncbi:hypothetical protein D1O75_26375, partial [Escherichia coli]|nr:hypothetical protein [Escherichia coli]
LWMTGRPAPFGDGRNGDSVIFNIYSADDPDAAGPLLLRAGRQAMLGKSMMYSRRFYPDGRIRPWKMPVSRFVRKHLADTDPAGG